MLDRCEEPGAVQASENLAVYAEPPKVQQDQVSDMEGASSIRVSSKVTPAPEFYEHHRNLVHHHHYHHHHANHNPHQQPYSNSQLGQAMRYHVHNQHANYPHHASASNSNAAMSVHGKLLMSNSEVNNNKAAKLTSSTRVNAPIGLGHETRETYEHANNRPQSYSGEQALPMRLHHYQSVKPTVIHYNHHYQQQQLPNHHNYPHFSHGVTRTQLNTDSIHQHGLALGQLRPHRNDMRSPLAQSSQAVPHYREIPTDRAETSFNDWSKSFAPGNNDINGTSDLTALNVLPNFGEQHRTNQLERDQEARQTATVPISILSSSSSNQPSSNLVTDQRPIMSYGQMKYAYSHPGTSQYVYSRPTPSHPTIISTNPHKMGQKLMIIRRPILQQLSQARPIVASMIMSSGGLQDLPSPQSASSSSPSSSRPLLMERKKAIYHGTSTKIIPNAKQNPPYNNNNNKNYNNLNNHNDSNDKNHYQVKKLMAFDDTKQRSKIQSKMSLEDDTIDPKSNTVQSAAIKPARNTGFDPDSIVIESGFKPIIRNFERDTSVGRSQELANFPTQPEDYPMDEPDKQNTNDGAYDIGEEAFEPMFVPSPLDRNSAKKQHILKKFRKIQSVRRKTRLDDLDDMEMAADRLDSYYLPPTGSGPKFNNKKIEENQRKSTLVTFDGKLIEDTSLARSIPRVEENKKPRSRLTSELLSQTPQFGKFKGELPPPIPGEVRIDNPPTVENHSYGAPRDRLVSNGGITRLTPLNRNKRSSDHHEIRVSYDSLNSTDFMRLDVQRHHDLSSHSEHDHNRADLSDDLYEHPEHTDHHHNHTDHSVQIDDHEQTSTGEMLIANIQYVVLTIILYYAI